MQLRDLLAHAAPYRKRLALIALVTVFGSLAMLAIPWLAGQLIGGTLSREVQGTDFVVELLVGTLVLTALLNITTSLLSNATSARILADLREAIFAHVVGLPMAFHDQGRQGDTLALMTYEIGRLSSFLTGTLATTPSTLLTTTGAVVMLFWLDPVLALLVPVLIPAFYLLLKILARRLRGIAQQRQAAEASVLAAAEESLEMLPAIKAFTREGAETVGYGQLVEHARNLSMREARIYAVLGPAVGLISAIAAVLLVLFASRKVAEGTMAPAEMFSFLLYTALLTRPVSMLADVYGQLQSARGTLARLQVVLDQSREPGHEVAGGLTRVRGEIAFRDVAFAYPGRDQTLNQVNLVIGAGTIVALTGANGAGKSTLVNLLLRYYEPLRGMITLDDQSITAINLTDLRRQIGYVPQMALLFNGTIRANIAFGLDGASDKQVLAAAMLAQASEFIAALPQGYDTIIGDHGVRLSGGQRQRLALARALIKNPPILILDEATSMYDVEGEAAFITACETALKGRTVILITHRPASLALANRIIAVEAGAVSEVKMHADPFLDARA